MIDINNIPKLDTKSVLRATNQEIENSKISKTRNQKRHKIHKLAFK